MTFEDFKKTCYHTRLLLKIPLLNTYVEKTRFIKKNGKYDFDKENSELRKIYEVSKLNEK